MNIEIRKMRPNVPKSIYSEEVEKKRLKDVKTILGKAALIEMFGKGPKIDKVTRGIKKSENALKWIEDTFKEEDE